MDDGTYKSFNKQLRSVKADDELIVLQDKFQDLEDCLVVEKTHLSAV